MRRYLTALGAVFLTAAGAWGQRAEPLERLTASPYTCSQAVKFSAAFAINNLTLASGSITDSSGAISFGNENLTTTGNIQCADMTVTGTLTGTIDADTLLGNTWAAPEAIGSGTPAAGTFTTLNANSTLQTGANGADGQLTIFSEQGGTDYGVVLKPHAAMTQTTTYYLPPDDGAASQYLQTDGSGNLSWAAASSGSYVELANATNWFSVDWTLNFDGDTDPQHFEIQIDNDADFATPIVDWDSRDGGDGGNGQTGCYYFNGTAWAAWTAAGGVTSAYDGQRACYTFQSATFSKATNYWGRVRLIEQGGTTGDWMGFRFRP